MSGISIDDVEIIFIKLHAVYIMQHISKSP